jgi:hypothetical protein
MSWRWEWDKNKLGTLWDTASGDKILKVVAGPRKKGQHDRFMWTVDLLMIPTKQRFEIITNSGGADVHEEVQTSAVEMVRYLAGAWQTYAARLPPPPPPGPPPLTGTLVRK